MVEESEISGLPWGSINLRYIIAKGDEEQRTQVQQNQLLADASILCGSSDAELPTRLATPLLDAMGAFYIPPDLLTIDTGFPVVWPETSEQGETGRSPCPVKCAEGVFAVP